MNYLYSEPPGYFKALKDFRLLELMERLSYLTQGECDPDCINMLTALLIKHLANLLPQDTVFSYCHALRKYKAEEVDRVLSVALKFPLPADSPTFFLDAQPPTFAFGAKVRWLPLDDLVPSDFGLIVGRFYGYLPERMRWSWCYVILLDPDCPSARWCSVDTAWESDLEDWTDE